MIYIIVEIVFLDSFFLVDLIKMVLSCLGLVLYLMFNGFVYIVCYDDGLIKSIN